MNINIFKIKLLIILEVIILAIVVIIATSHNSKSFTPIRNTEERAAEQAEISADQDTADGQAADVQTAEDQAVEDQAAEDQAAYSVISGTNLQNPISKKELLKNKVTRTGTLGIDYPVVSYYGPRESLMEGMSTDHKGIDFAMDLWTELISPYECRVVYTGYNEFRGNWVVLYWKDGIYVELQHMSEVNVWAGEALEAGDHIGYSGETGVSVIPHLHLEILLSGDGTDSIINYDDQSYRVDPYYYVFDTVDEF